MGMAFRIQENNKIMSENNVNAVVQKQLYLKMKSVMENMVDFQI